MEWVISEEYLLRRTDHETLVLSLAILLVLIDSLLSASCVGRTRTMAR